MLRIFYIVLLAAGAAALFWLTAGPFSVPRFERTPKTSGTILFLGDVMLSRNVEALMRARGVDYPFEDTSALITRHDFAVGNLEGAVPEQHEPTPPGGFQFSIDASHIPALRRAGFSILTLANNHAFDFGERAYEHTRATLAAQDLLSAGHPLQERVDDALIIAVGDTKVALMPIHDVGRTLQTDELSATLAALSAQSDLQFVLPHWGDEYVPSAPERVRALARALIDAGADAVIGHHPHVVQDVEMYNRAPIFYSLGNFVFDQYFSEEVQEGLALSVTVHPDRTVYDLVPLQSAGSVPFVLAEPKRTEALFVLAERSDPAVAADIRSGALTVPR